MVLAIIRGTQIGLRDPTLVDRLKSEMIADKFAFDEERGQIGGVIDSRGIYHVIEGHHRMAAALDLFHEIGDDKFVQALLQRGRWSKVESVPVDSRPFPARSAWRAFRNWLGF